MDPHHHGQPGGAIGLRRPHIEIEAVLAERPGIAAVLQGEPRHLHAGVAVRVGLAHALPRGGGPGFVPAQVADGRRRVGDPLEGGYTPLGHALDLACPGPDDRRGLGLSGGRMGEDHGAQQGGGNGANDGFRVHHKPLLAPSAGPAPHVLQRALYGARVQSADRGDGRWSYAFGSRFRSRTTSQIGTTTTAPSRK